MMGWWIGYAKAGREFAVQDAIAALGMESLVARKVVALRRGKQRWPEAVETPWLPNYVFIGADDADWHKLLEVKYLARTLRPVPHVLKPALLAFIDEATAECREEWAKIKAGQRIAEYAPGDALTIVGGPLAGHLATFRRIVETAHDLFPRIVAEAEIMGHMATVELDPINARKAG